jgi:hypothetical protein
LNFFCGFLGSLCVFFAHFFGRSSARLYKRTERQSRWLAWALRTIVTALAVLWRRGLDTISLATLVLAGLAFAAGAYDEWRPRRQEEISKILFPE